MAFWRLIYGANWVEHFVGLRYVLQFAVSMLWFSDKIRIHKSQNQGLEMGLPPFAIIPKIPLINFLFHSSQLLALLIWRCWFPREKHSTSGHIDSIKLKITGLLRQFMPGIQQEKEITVLFGVNIVKEKLGCCYIMT